MNWNRWSCEKRTRLRNYVLLFYFFCDSICFINSWFGVKARWFSWHGEDWLFPRSALHSLVSALIRPDPPQASSHLPQELSDGAADCLSLGLSRGSQQGQPGNILYWRAQLQDNVHSAKLFDDLVIGVRTTDCDLKLGTNREDTTTIYNFTTCLNFFLSQVNGCQKWWVVTTWWLLSILTPSPAPWRCWWWTGGPQLCTLSICQPRSFLIRIIGSQTTFYISESAIIDGNLSFLSRTPLCYFILTLTWWVYEIRRTWECKLAAQVEMLSLVLSAPSDRRSGESLVGGRQSQSWSTPGWAGRLTTRKWWTWVSRGESELDIII